MMSVPQGRPPSSLENAGKEHEGLGLSRSPSSAGCVGAVGEVLSPGVRTPRVSSALFY